jgi:hypothetical protein
VLKLVSDEISRKSFLQEANDSIINAAGIIISFIISFFACEKTAVFFAACISKVY